MGGRKVPEDTDHGRSQQGLGDRRGRDSVLPDGRWGGRPRRRPCPDLLPPSGPELDAVEVPNVPTSYRPPLDQEHRPPLLFLAAALVLLPRAALPCSSRVVMLCISGGELGDGWSAEQRG
jgi:hypothetical protein